MAWWLLLINVGVFILGYLLGFLAKHSGKRLRIRFSLDAEGRRGNQAVLDQTGLAAVPSPTDPGAPSTAASKHPQGTEHP